MTYKVGASRSTESTASKLPDTKDAWGEELSKIVKERTKPEPDEPKWVQLDKSKGR